MPEMSDGELLKKIRKIPGKENIKCAFITAVGFTKKGLDELKKLGISDYIKKPFREKDLINRVNKKNRKY